jgi:glutamate-1-semialdehyde 2,1-aminomutase
MFTATISSNEIYQQLCEVIPGGVNSPVRAFKGLGLSPMVAARGAGAEIWDVDGNSYIDYCCSWGALIHGHAHPVVVEAAQEQTRLGSTFGVTTAGEGELARMIIAHMPSIEQLRFVSTGTEATMSAVRLARGYTGRHLIVKYAGHYHGHADGFLVQAGSGVFGNTPTSSSAGIPPEFLQHTACLPYNDSAATRDFFEMHGDKIAAVIVEPVAGNMGVVPAEPEFLALLRQLTEGCGAVLIFDEVMTGFRVALGGAQALYGIQPDLAPLGPVYQAGTLSGNPVAMAAGKATISLLEERAGVYAELQHKADMVTQSICEYLALRDLPVCVQQQGSMFTLFFGCRRVKTMDDAHTLDGELFARFFRHLFQRGIYAPPSQHEAWFVSTAHTEEQLIYTRNTILEFLRELAV